MDAKHRPAGRRGPGRRPDSPADDPLGDPGRDSGRDSGQQAGSGTGLRALYAYDASNYRVVPAAVSFPRDTDDVVAQLRQAREAGRPVTARGGGTSLAGNAVGSGLVLDFSRHMNRVIALDPAARRAVVQPGLVLDDLQAAAATHGLRFGPDPSSHSRCTLGGMIGNDACGAHSVRHGRTGEHVVALDLVLADGTRAIAERGRLRAADAGDPPAVQRVAALEDELRRLAARHLAVLRTELGRIPRQVSGYQLQHLLPERGFDVARALVGTEGGCAVVVAATVALVRQAPCSVLVAIGYRDLVRAAADVPRILAHDPSAVEAMDAALVATMRARRGPGALQGLPDGAAWLLVGLDGEHPAEPAERARVLLADPAAPIVAGRVLGDPDERRRVWRIREDGAGLATRPPGPRQYWPGWEDAAVAPDRLAGYLQEFGRLLGRHGLTGAFYGHFGAGCVHVRLDFDPETAAGRAGMRAFLREAAELVTAHGGTLSGEHGDGRARGELLPIMYSAEALAAFARFKDAWDPDHLLNPGIVVDPPPLDADLAVPLRRGAAGPRTAFAFPEDPGGLAGAVRRCVGVGRCRADAEHGGGVMCPSFRATRREQDSTRGRARALQEMLRGDLVTRGWRATEVLDTLDLCLACKACAADCPVEVDMATYKAEFLHQHYRRRIRPRSHYALGWLPTWTALAGAVPGGTAACNAVLGRSLTRRLAARLAGLTPHRTMPALYPPAAAGSAVRQAAGAAGGSGDPALLFLDTFTRAFRPGLAGDATTALRALGTDPRPVDRWCCGLTWISTGQLARARRVLERTVAALDAAEPAVPIVVLEPGCAAALRADAPALLGTAAARRVAGRVITFTGMLGRALDGGWHPPALPAAARLQVHCHEYAVFGEWPQPQVLARMGVTDVATASTCCGMAGSFGMERDHYPVSLAVADLSLAPLLEPLRGGRDADRPLLADGFSCRLQAEHLAPQARPQHLAELVATALAAGR